LRCCGIRGAITVESNTKEAIVSAAKELLQNMVEANAVDVGDIAGVWFTTTSDLNAEFPAVAARQLGWTGTAMICGHEMNVPGSLSNCLRVMMLVNTGKKNQEIVHVYLKGASALRGDISTAQRNSTHDSSNENRSQ
jgi:chorismate mutase